jgi:hypothetical protein
MKVALAMLHARLTLRPGDLLSVTVVEGAASCRKPVAPVTTANGNVMLAPSAGTLPTVRDSIAPLGVEDDLDPPAPRGAGSGNIATMLRLC